MSVFTEYKALLLTNMITSIHRVRAYGPGIEPKGRVVNAPANFTVETFAAGKGIEIVLMFILFQDCIDTEHYNNPPTNFINLK